MWHRLLVLFFSGVLIQLHIAFSSNQVTLHPMYLNNAQVKFLSSPHVNTVLSQRFPRLYSENTSPTQNRLTLNVNNFYRRISQRECFTEQSDMHKHISFTNLSPLRHERSHNSMRHSQMVSHHSLLKSRDLSQVHSFSG